MTTHVDRAHQPGTVILVDLEPVRGTEQSGRRPAVIVSTIEMNTLTRRVIICPITRNRTPWPSKVFLPEGLNIEGAILSDQVRSIDRDVRILRVLGVILDHVLAEVRAKLAALIGLTFGRPGLDESPS